MLHLSRVALICGLVWSVHVAPALGQASARTDRVLDLVSEARRSPCFLAPMRPPLLLPVGAEIAVSAAQGDGSAMRQVAEAYLADPARPRQALDWLERAALAGSAAAAADAGSLHAAGRGTPQDEDIAALWWQFGATRGDSRSMACLSAAYLLGFGVEQSLVEATRWALLREQRAPGRLLLKPAMRDFERVMPATTLAEARGLARQVPEPAAPPPTLSRWDEPIPAVLPQAVMRSIGPLANMVLPPRLTGSVVESSGSGVVVGEAGVVLTSAHVVQNCLALEVRAGLAHLGGVELRAQHVQHDLALLSVPGLSRAPLPVRSDLRLGEEVILIGFPGAGLGNQDATVTVGNVSAFGSGDRDGRVQFTSPLTAGNSGGPLLDRRGQIVGIAVQTATLIGQLVTRGDAPQNVNLAVTARVIGRFLEDHGVALGQAGSLREVPDIVSSAARSVVQVVCHRRARPSASAARTRPTRPSPVSD